MSVMRARARHGGTNHLRSMKIAMLMVITNVPDQNIWLEW
jgi:hypothetical protein